MSGALRRTKDRLTLKRPGNRLFDRLLSDYSSLEAMSMADLPLPQIQKVLILGIDLGSSSLGTALVNPESQEIPFLGARIFPAGVGGDTEENRAEARSAQPRHERPARRQR